MLLTTLQRMCGSCVCLLHLFLVLLILNKDCDGSHELNWLSTDFNKHKIVQPIIHHGRTKREISTTRDINGAHHSEVTMTVLVDGEELVLDLQLNEDLVAGDHTLQYQEKGETVNYKVKREELDLCHYSGSVRDKPNSWVAVSTCNGISGAINDGHTMRYIEPVKGNEIHSQHYLYDHKDLNTEHHCGTHGGVTNETQYGPELSTRHRRRGGLKKSHITRYKRDTEVRGPYNANKLSRYVELVLVADYRMFKASGGSVKALHSRMIQLVNIINSVYSPLNIYIALVGVVIWSEGDKIQLKEDGDTTLANFLDYREKKLITKMPNDNAQLLTKQRFTSSNIGKGYIGQMCSLKRSGGIATDHSQVNALVAMTIAHEMGHNFGMHHDTNECECPDKKCIMSPSSTDFIPVHWSSCSLNYLKQSFKTKMDYNCLHNKPKRLFGSSTCGNGFVEPGEQCDCGTELTGGTSPCHACCHPETCMLRRNATCGGAGTCCDLATCRPKAAGAVCRRADKECDLPEFCSGHSEFCPGDVYKMDTTPCGSGRDQAYCVRGSCSSQNEQCRLLWGPTGEASHPECYTDNKHGNWYANCGYDPVKQSFIPCPSDDDAFCGTLQCRHFGAGFPLGASFSWKHDKNVTANGKLLFSCRRAIMYTPKTHPGPGAGEADPGLVPDGARCGDGKMCLQQRCVSIESLRKTIANTQSSVCPSKCSGRGVCNSKGHCHCSPGFAPPLCADPGAGGSTDSGPASATVQRNYVIVVYVIFLGIVPLVILVLCIVFYWRCNTCCCGINYENCLKYRFVKCSSSKHTNCNFWNLPTFKKCNTKNIEVKEHHESIEESANTKSSFKVLHLAREGVKMIEEFIQKTVRKMNKEEIQIATDVDAKPAIGEVWKPSVLPKPERLKTEPTVVIANNGLTSITNIGVKMIEKPLHKPVRKTIKDMTNLVTHDVKPVEAMSSNMLKPSELSKPRRLETKPSVIIANKDLVSTTNMADIMFEELLQKSVRKGTNDHLATHDLKPVNAGISSDVWKPPKQPNLERFKPKPSVDIAKEGLTNLGVKMTEEPLKKPIGKITKDKIHIATHNLNPVNAEIERSREDWKPAELPKPHKIKTKQSVVIRNNALASTTNVGVKIIEKPLQKPVRSINKDEIRLATHEVNVVKAGVKNVSKPLIVIPKPERPNTKPPVVPKPAIPKTKPPVVVVNKGLTSTTNAMLKKGRFYNVGGGNA